MSFRIEIVDVLLIYAKATPEMFPGQVPAKLGLLSQVIVRNFNDFCNFHVLISSKNYLINQYFWNKSLLYVKNDKVNSFSFFLYIFWNMYRAIKVTQILEKLRKVVCEYGCILVYTQTPLSGKKIGRITEP